MQIRVKSTHVLTFAIAYYIFILNSKLKLDSVYNSLIYNSAIQECSTNIQNPDILPSIPAIY